LNWPIHWQGGRINFDDFLAGDGQFLVPGALAAWGARWFPLGLGGAVVRLIW
jgi:hypothetical protein